MTTQETLKSQNQPDPLRWYALYTRSRCERRITQDLEEKGLESYAPFHTVVRQWSDRRKKVQMPLFSCYVFVRTSPQQRMAAIQTDGVAYMVSVKGVPSVVPDHEIEAIRRVLSTNCDFEPVAYPSVGEIVSVIRGPLAGISGRIVEYHGTKRLVIGVAQIKHGISVVVDVHDIVPAVNLGAGRVGASRDLIQSRSPKSLN